MGDEGGQSGRGEAAATYRKVEAGVEEPVGVGEGSELGRDAAVLLEAGLAGVAVPLEEDVDEAVFLEAVVRRAGDGAEERTQRRRVDGRKTQVGLADAATEEEDIEEEEVGHAGTASLDLGDGGGVPRKGGGSEAGEPVAHGVVGVVVVGVQGRCSSRRTATTGHGSSFSVVDEDNKHCC